MSLGSRSVRLVKYGRSIAQLSNEFQPFRSSACRARGEIGQASTSITEVAILSHGTLGFLTFDVAFGTMAHQIVTLLVNLPSRVSKEWRR
jgi:hypothetical protein